MLRLKDKVAIVTGGGGGIGRAICRALAAQGAAVACVDIDETAARAVAASEGLPGCIRAYAADITRRESVRELAQRIDADFGRIDVLVNNAMWIRFDPIEAVDEAVVDRMFAIGLKALFWTTQAVAPMLARRGGSIVNMASIAAVRGTPNRLVYCTVKGGVVAMTLECAAELGPQGIRVNAIAPGAVLANPGTAERLGPQGIQLRLDTTPLKRLGQPEEVADVVLFLASDDSRFVTGTLIPVDGGRLITA